MMLSSCALPLVLMVAVQTPSVVLPSFNSDTLPTDVTGPSRGPSALTVDPAAAGELMGAAVQVRHVGTPQIKGTGALRLAGQVPLGSLSLSAAYAWGNLPDPKSALATLGLSLRLHERLRFGVQWQRYKPAAVLQHRSLWGAGFLWQPHRVVSASLGVDAVNAPAFTQRLHMRRALRLGVGIRPFHGDPLVTVGADARMSWADGAHFPDVRALLDVSPYQGLHLYASYQRLEEAHIGWAGISLDVMGAQALAAGRVAHALEQDSADRLALALTLQRHDQSAAPLNIKRDVHIDVASTLRPPKGPPWRREEQVAMLPARMARLAKATDVALVTLHMGQLDVGYATVSELRDAIALLKRSGIKVAAHLQTADTKTYLVAAAADHITMDPVGTLDIRGNSLRHLYWGEALAHFGVRVEVVAQGRYKTAPELWSRAQPSDAQTEVGCSIVRQLYAHTLSALQQDRGLEQAMAHQALASGPMGAKQAMALGLVDVISTRPRAVPNGLSGQSSRKLRQTHLLPHDGAAHEPTWGPGPKIAVVGLTGVMAQEEASMPYFGRTSSVGPVLRALTRAKNDADVKGVVLRIDSPGGDVLAAEEVLRAMQDVAAVKPVAVSMADVAASGGYWAALAAHRIFAEPETLTGSIGIYSLRLNAQELLQKWNIGSQAQSVGERSDSGAWQEAMGELERERAQQHIDDLYAMFVQRVADNRKLTFARAQEISLGRVYTGAQALELHLIDALGGLYDAIDWVTQQARVADDGALTWKVAHTSRSLWDALPGMALHAQAWQDRPLTMAAALSSWAGATLGPQALALPLLDLYLFSPLK